MAPARPRCPYCRQPVRVEDSAKGAVQLDPEPAPDGRFVIRRLRTESGVELGASRAHFLAIGEQPRDGEATYTGHRYTCERQPKDRDRDQAEAQDDGRRQLPTGDR